MPNKNIQIEPGEITVVLSEDANTLARHACHTARKLLDKNIGVQLVNCGMTTKRFWGHAHEEIGPTYITGRYGGRKVNIQTLIRGNMYADRAKLFQIREELHTKVVIINGWEWSSKNWKLKEDLLFHLREITEDENVAVIIYSQARTNPVRGRFDRGGIGKLAGIALSIVRIEEDESEVLEEKKEPLIISPEDEIEAEKFAQLVANKFNELDTLHAEERLPERVEEEVPLEEEVEYA
jgi:hypothetical protein